MCPGSTWLNRKPIAAGWLMLRWTTFTLYLCDEVIMRNRRFYLLPAIALVLVYLFGCAGQPRKPIDILRQAEQAEARITDYELATNPTDNDLVVGVDFHTVLVPTVMGPVPTPLPLPFVGMIYDPMGQLVGAAISQELVGNPGIVLVNGLPVANCLTNVTNMFTLPHPPVPAPGTAYAFGPPPNNAMLYFGSLNNSLQGSFGVRLGDVALSCSDPRRLPTSMV